MSELIFNIISENDTNSLAYSNYFHLFTNSTNDIVFILNESGTIEFANKALLTQSHFRLEDIIGKHFFELLHEQNKSKVSDAFQNLIGSKTSVKFETEIIPKVGVEQLYEITLTPIFQNEKLTSLFGVGINLSKVKAEKSKIEELLSKLTEANRLTAIERDRAQQQISVLNELNNLKNEFISNVSHELRTPLASIIGFAETISEDKNLTLEKVEEFNQVILTESKRLAKLINDVLDFSELESEKQKLQKSSLNIIEVINECNTNIKIESEKKNITLTSRIPQSEIMIYADEERIRKVISYLLLNAVKFTKENGRITIIVQEFLKELEIVISDTGIGIPEQNIPFLFDKFSKVKRTGFNLTGAGFGLVTVKQIIDLHKGLIRVKSEVNKGTSFIIRLPKYSFN
ncbi:MAG: PAS domain-containing sensor histidine kinase [Melioribacteraceae bacterium]